MALSSMRETLGQVLLYFSLRSSFNSFACTVSEAFDLQWRESLNSSYSPQFGVSSKNVDDIFLGPVLGPTTTGRLVG